MDRVRTGITKYFEVDLTLRANPGLLTHDKGKIRPFYLTAVGASGLLTHGKGTIRPVRSPDFPFHGRPPGPPLART